MKIMNKIAVLGTGAWGTTLANVLLDNKQKVAMWGISESEISDLKKQTNTKYYGSKKLSKPLALVTTNIIDIINFNPNFIIIAIPSKFIEDVINKIINRLKSKPIFINVAKGFNPLTRKTWSYTIEDLIQHKASGLVTLIGPSFAVEVFNKEITVVNTVSSNILLAKKVAKIFSNKYFKCVSINDVYGAETMAALKNVMAIGSGIIYSQHESINTRAAILAQITHEISEIASLMGGHSTSLYQFCGIGDIFLTCTDNKSRNFSFGELVGRKGFAKAKKQLKEVTVEGYWATLIAYEIIKKNNINAPIISHIYKILYENENAKDFVKNVIKEIQ